MPDLVTHLCAAQLARRGGERLARRELAEFPAACWLLGNCLPDLLARVPGMFCTSRLFQLLHEPVPCLLACYALCMLLPGRLRRQAFAWTAMGSLLHQALDMLQRTVGGPSQFWLYPFSWRSWDMGLFWPDQAILAAPFLLAAVAAVEIDRWRRESAR
ncbi:hypothetical protein NNJEOMEG_01589 [Fundidesulfovibrio magnetotacticus]|uniref:Metal-dependent hydrolase n=1 Tax=Fundidesulfovibrio magnetotacticus TaxID=2730080 RepID=A0A6V8LZU7_9BACT|nr:hypothetical protein [Fundidesulfovibrio magnetotacticus]GFK93755.1 hypothetical protein NNJEOMEG_01589 [Fundidesulfovibrio magnetotacticus]